MDGETFPGRANPTDEIAAVFTAAGWAPHFGLHGYSRQTAGGWLVGGAPDPAQPLVTHLKITDKDPNTPDTPDDPVEAAQWLVARHPAPSAELSTAATLETPVVEEYAAPDETHGETGEAEACEAAAPAVDFAEAPDHSAGPVGPELLPPETTDHGAGRDEALGVIEGELADFEDLEPDDSLGLGDESDYRSPLLLEGEPEAESPADELHADPPQDRFYGLDDLDRRRNLRIGDVAVKAAQLTTEVEAAANEQEGEYASVQGYVVTHLDPHTGAFTGGDQDAWQRFLALDGARRAKAAIEQSRKEKTTFLLFAEREQVEAFDVDSDWP